MSDARNLEAAGVLKLEDGGFRALESYVAVTSQSLWAHDAVMGTAETADAGTGLVLGTRVRFSVPGQVTGAWFQKSLAAEGEYTASLWEQDAEFLSVTLLRTTTEAKTGTGWHRIAFATPCPVIVANDTNNFGYVVSIHYTRSDRASAPFGYYATGHYFDFDYIVGDLNAPAGNVSQNAFQNGRFSYNSDASTYPSSQFESASYFIDLDFEAT